VKRVILFCLIIFSEISWAQLSGVQYNFLKRLVEVGSATDNPAGLAIVRQRIVDEFSAMGFLVKTLTLGSAAGAEGHKVLQIRMAKSDNKITLLGHTDTVFSDALDFRNISKNGKMIYGSGVIDMKGGIVLIREIVQGLSVKEREHLQIILNDDEEIGSIYSKQILRSLIPLGSSVLVYEPGLPDGSVVSSQSGVVWFQLDTFGKAAHAGLEPEKGFSACTEISYKLTKVAELSDLSKNLNFNPGLVSGGTKPNVVCERATAKIDMRFRTMDQFNENIVKIQKITDTVLSHFIPANFVPTATLKQISLLPPLNEERTLPLFNIISEIGRSMGINFKKTYVGYASDGNNLSDLPINIIVGLGPYGGGMHTKDEFMDTSSFESRLRLSLDLVKKLTDNITKVEKHL
jgi:glutamate carboxypeptidase